MRIVLPYSWRKYEYTHISGKTIYLRRAWIWRVRVDRFRR